jgi:hypothetical protein
MTRKPTPRSYTRTINGDAHLTAFIDASDFLEDEEFPEEEIPDPPDEAQCQ